MATYLIDSKADIARAAHIKIAVENGDMAASILTTKRPSDFSCWQGVLYGGSWYPPSDPRGAELVKLRYMLPAGQAKGPEWWEHDWRPEYRYSVVLINHIPKPPQTPRSVSDIARDTAYCLALNELSETLHNHAFLAAQKGADVKPEAPQPSPEPRSEAKPHRQKKEPSPTEKACRRLSESKGHWDAMWQAQQRWLEARQAGEAKRDEAVRASALKPAPILPQLFQSKEDILERIAMNNAKPHPDRLSELCEACAYGVEHYANEEARTIFDGFYLRKNELGTRILLRHRDHPNHVAVGETDILTGEMVYIGERPAIREYMAKVIAGMAPSTNGKLPGILMQTPIPDDAKQEPLRSGNNQHAEVAPDELPLFAGGDPGGTA